MEKTVILYLIIVLTGVNLPVMAQWSTVGPPGFSAGRADNLSLAVSQSGVPYVAYAPFTGTRKISVQKYSPGWTLVGNGDFSAGYAESISLAINPATDEPYVAYVDLGNSYKATVMKWENGSNTWVSVGIPGFTASSVSYTCLGFNIFGDPYIAFSDNSQGGKASVMKYTILGGWQYVGSPGFSSASVTFLSFGLQPLTLTPVVAFSDHQFSPPKATVMQYSSPGIGSAVWNNVGSPGFSQFEARDLSLAFKPLTNEPYLAYVDYQSSTSSMTATVKRFNSQYSTWDIVGANPVYPGNVERTKLAFLACGKPVVGFIDGSFSNKATVVLLNNSGSWTVLGSSGISAGGITYPDMKLWPSGKLYLGFMDLANSMKATVMTFDGTLSLSATTIPSTCGNKDGCLDLTVSGGYPPYTYFWSNNATDQDICNLTCGTYSVTVTDDYCNEVTGTWLYDDLIIEAVICSKPNCEGSIDLTVSCGTPPYNYAWNNLITTQDLSWTCQGTTYCVTVEDMNNRSKHCCFTGKKKSGCDANYLQNLTVTNGTSDCYEATQNIYVAGNSTTFIVLAGGSATMVAGQKINYFPGTKVYAGGYMTGRISTNGQYCNKSINRTENTETAMDSVARAGTSEHHPHFNVFPNPTDGTFFLKLNENISSSVVMVEILSMQGEKISSIEMKGEPIHEFSLAGNPKGVYFIRVVMGEQVVTRKIIRQ